MGKPKVGIFGITGCMGCQLEIVYQEVLLKILDAIDLIAFPVGKEKNNWKGDFDLIFMEGLVANKEDLRMLKDLRSRTKILVALGACACDACVPAIKHFVNGKKAMNYVYGDKQKHLNSLEAAPIDKYVKVDYYIRGCPADKEEVLQFVKAVLTGKEFKVEEKSICHNCNLQGNACLIEQGKECLGPVTFGNCSVMCPEFQHPCVGCRGPYSDANFEAYFEVMEKNGFSKEHVMQRLNKYAGIRFKELMEGKIDIDKGKRKEKETCNSMFCNVEEKDKSSFFCGKTEEKESNVKKGKKGRK